VAGREVSGETTRVASGPGRGAIATHNTPRRSPVLNRGTAAHDVFGVMRAGRPGMPPLPRGAAALIACLALSCTARNPAYWPHAKGAGDAEAPEPDVPLARPPTISPADASPAAADARAPAIDVAALLPDAAPPAAEDGPAQRPDVGPDAASGPRRLEVEPAGMTMVYGGPKGTAHTDTCSGDQVLIGYRGSLTPNNGGDLVLAHLAGECGELIVSGGNPYVVSTAARGTLTTRGEPAGSTFTALCGPNQVVVGMRGAAGFLVDRLQLACAPLAISGVASLSASIGTRSWLTARGGPGGTVFEEGCPAGEVARGHNLRSGAAIDAFGLACGRPTIVVP
jgi:hypothetical protein